MLLGAWLEMWYSVYVEGSSLRENSKRNYRQSISAIAAALPSADLQQDLPFVLAKYLMQRAAVAPRAAQLDRIALVRSMRLARKLGYTDAIIDDETLPKVSHQAAKAAILTGEQLTEYLIAAASSKHRARLGLLCVGLRRGEVLGVLSEDVQADGLHVVRQMQTISGSLTACPLKSRHSARVVPLPDFLRVWLAEGLPPCATAQLYREHRKALQRANLPPVTLHGLRHSFATAAIRDGYNPKMLQEVLGHGSLTITLDLYCNHAAVNVPLLPPFLVCRNNDPLFLGAQKMGQM